MGATVRWYNSARRIPLLVGKLPSGEQIWGGPYRASQAVAGCTVTVLAFVTRGAWGPLIAGPGLVGMITTLVVSVIAGAGAGWAAGRLPLGSDPVLEGSSILSQGLRTSSAKWGNAPVRVGTAYRLRARPRVLPIGAQEQRLLPLASVGGGGAPAVAAEAPRGRRVELGVSADVVASEDAAPVPVCVSSPAQKLAVLMESR